MAFTVSDGFLWVRLEYGQGLSFRRDIMNFVLKIPSFKTLQHLFEREHAGIRLWSFASDPLSLHCLKLGSLALPRVQIRLLRGGTQPGWHGWPHRGRLQRCIRPPGWIQHRRHQLHRRNYLRSLARRQVDRSDWSWTGSCCHGNLWTPNHLRPLPCRSSRHPRVPSHGRRY